MTTIRTYIGKSIVSNIIPRDDSTPTVRALLSSLPFEARVHRWGDEIYFETPFHSDLEPDARAEMSIAEVAFWPEGDALAIFFGPTPVSRESEPRAYSPCNIVGRIDAAPEALRSAAEGMPVRLTASP